MSGLIPRAFIDDLIARVDLVELINASVPLKRSGKNYMACCPFHKEKTPSFSVSPEGQFYHCFGCGQSGNAISFLMDYQRYDFVEAVENLASRAGLEVPRESNSQQAQEHAQSKILYELVEAANQFYQQQLRIAPDKDRAVDYLKGRGLSGQIAKHFQIGYAPQGWNNLINSAAISSYKPELLVKAGLSIAKNEQGAHDRDLQYDRFRDRIIFPIRDSRGRCIGFGGRVLGDEKPKYLNSPETPVFNKGKELYGFYEARQANSKLKKVLVVEGYMDVIALAQMGIKNAVATLGTAIGSDHLHLLFRHIQEIVFCFDGDLAGRQAAERALHNALPFLQDGRQIRFLFLEEGEDPDSMVRKEGQALFEQRVSTAQPFSEFFFAHLGQGLDMSTMDGKAGMAKLATPLLNQMPKGLFFEMMVSRLADITQLDKNIISQSLQNADKQEKEKAQQRAAQQQSYVQQSSKPQPKPKEADDHGLYQQYENMLEALPDEVYSQAQHAYEEAYPLDAEEEPRVSAVNHILTYLLRQPELAKSCEIPEEVYKLRTYNIDLLVELINYIKASESRVSTAMILGHWHNTAEGFLLSSLAVSEILLSEEEQEKEFQGALKQLIAQFFSQEIASLKGHTPEEKTRLKTLLQEKARFRVS